MHRRSHMAWKTARHLCHIQGIASVLFSPTGTIRLSLDIFRNNKPFALLSNVLPYGKHKPQEIVMALNNLRQSLATTRFQSADTNMFSLPSFIFYPIFFLYCTTPTLFILKLKCFPPLLHFNTPHKAVIYCTSAFCKSLPATKKTEPFMFCLAPEGKTVTH